MARSLSLKDPHNDTLSAAQYGANRNIVLTMEELEGVGSTQFVLTPETALQLIHFLSEVPESEHEPEPLADWEKELQALPTDPKGRMRGDILITGTAYSILRPNDEFRVLAVRQTWSGWEYSGKKIGDDYVFSVPSEYFLNN